MGVKIFHTTEAKRDAIQWISRHVDDNDLEGQQNHDLPWAAKALATSVGVLFPVIAYSFEKITPRH